MVGVQTQASSSEAIAKREPLSEEGLGSLLAGIGNHEGKATLLVAMAQASPAEGEEHYFSQGDLH
jgi:hypothetical protein